jgi:hypothetical protein
MNKTNLNKLKRQIKKSVSEICDDDDVLSVSNIINNALDNFYNPPIPEKKGYIASTGGQILTSVVRTKGQSEKADSVRGFSK